MAKEIELEKSHKNKTKLAVLYGITYLLESPNMDEDVKFLNKGDGIFYWKIVTIKKLRVKNKHSIIEVDQVIRSFHQHSKVTEDLVLDIIMDEKKELYEKVMKNKDLKEPRWKKETCQDLLEYNLADLIASDEYVYFGAFRKMEKIFDQKIGKFKTKELIRQ